MSTQRKFVGFRLTRSRFVLAVRKCSSAERLRQSHFNPQGFWSTETMFKNLTPVFTLAIMVLAATALIEARSDASNGEPADEATVISLSDCPHSVQRTLKRESGDGKIDNIVRETDEGETVYEAEIQLVGKKYEVEIRADGTLLEKVLDEEDEEQTIELQDCPDVVQDTLRRESAGGEIDEIIRETEDGCVTFEAEVEIDGKEYEVEVLPDGTLVEKSLDVDEDDEDEEDDEEEDDDDDDDDDEGEDD